ncbi:FAD-dependent oxidoreductase [Mycobacterium sp. CVI_P3]|uniref:FAD-dependent oxidoreductase n=1 Tax=Mycobacterium pinniadriaticum TaxID=2994102 RepID=A0ABT3SAH2_9MYCO|nr:FAD-dependent oxidoreductase [Mycobacterium pinniadriaticum]MCX2929448.1 FAD-dependent oxidoreductase [Mycobacterium pinniadriaticum]MCX2935872.1 FAD-dependent oxidoreductase [Mycobacterium pinniadriaticum]
MNKPKVVIAGFGDSGLLTAIRLGRHFDIVGISAKPALLSGQELGLRLARPKDWARDNWVSFDKYRALDRVRTVQATLTGLDLEHHTVHATTPDGTPVDETYDFLVISTGVRNGFWRQPTVQTPAEIAADLTATHDRLGAARSVIIVGGGAAAVSAAANIATAWPGKKVDLYFPAERALTEHHPRAWERLRDSLIGLGVGVHPGHRAVLPEGFDGDEITDAPVQWSTGQPPAHADAVLWAIGRVKPNTDWLPPELLDEQGFVKVTPELQLCGHHRVFAIGDVAATDPLRASARARADGLLAHNIKATLAGRPLKRYRAPRRRWGSIVGIQSDGLEVFAPNGTAYRFPAWSIDRVLMPWIVRWGIYKGVRKNQPLS